MKRLPDEFALENRLGWLSNRKRSNRRKYSAERERERRERFDFSCPI